MQLITFYLGPDRFALPILGVKEVLPMPRITTVQTAPASIEGLINLRGQVVTVYNLGTLLDRTPVEKRPTCHLILLRTCDELSPEAVKDGVRTGKESLALLVERNSGIISVDPGAVDNVPSREVHHLVAGIVRLDNELITLLDAARICQADLEHKRGVNAGQV